MTPKSMPVKTLGTTDAIAKCASTLANDEVADRFQRGSHYTPSGHSRSVLRAQRNLNGTPNANPLLHGMTCYAERHKAWTRQISMLCSFDSLLDTASLFGRIDPCLANALLRITTVGPVALVHITILTRVDSPTVGPAVSECALRRMRHSGQVYVPRPCSLPPR